MEATLITLAGFSLLAAFRKGSASACVRKNGDLTLRSMTLSQPFSGKASNSASQAAPALLTRISSLGSRSRYAPARSFAPSTVETSCGSGKQVPPFLESSAAVSSQAAAFREEM